MAEQVKIFWVNLIVGILGLGVGVSYLLKMLRDDSSVRDLIFGIICLVLATGWLVYVYVSKKVEVSSENGSKL